MAENQGTGQFLTAHEKKLLNELQNIELERSGKREISVMIKQTGHAPSHKKRNLRNSGDKKNNPNVRHILSRLGI
ncbi:hypothetical protein [Bacillus sp. MUM 13]|uniref:hypothetical protein n=1 Tax=Bacillus sp. MUM 13 TaxID=1678001 RepID=UPI0008F5F17A|nr:hypothetical protein [Bacillus sp. MUM 13]OIK12717.1 hypothetical protein BIV59_07795 [Bacillus sp. MUM 13]